MRITFTIFLLAFFCISTAQNIENLKKSLDTASNITSKIDILTDLTHSYTQRSTDTALIYAKKALNLIEQESLEEKKGELFINLGVVYLKRSDNKKADSLFDIALSINKKRADKNYLALTYLNYGLNKSDQHDYESAINYYLKAAHLADSLRDSTLTINTYINIGIIYYYQENVRKALNYHLKGLEMFRKYDVEKANNYATTLRNTGAFYSILQKPDSAFYYTEKSLEVSQKLNDRRGISVAYQNLGEIIYPTSPNKAKKYFSKSLELKKELKNIRGIAHTAGNLANCYQNEKDFPKAIQYSKMAINHAEQINDIMLISHNYGLLSACYEEIGNKGKALEAYKKYSTFRDSMQAKSNESKILELQTQYETAEKQKEILELKHQQKLNDITIQNNKLTISITIGGIILVILFLLNVLRTNTIVRKRNKLLRLKNATIEQQNEEIMVQRDHLSEKNEFIELQNKEIGDSIKYARQIQESLLPSKIMIDNILHDHALFYRPKNVVSGDFYWVHQINNFTFVAVGDCTGHGVPGAFMSILSISLLNEIVKGEKNTQPAEILNKMRNLIISSLKQKGKNMRGKDGLELALCIIDQNKKTLTYAGAQRPLIQIKQKEVIEYTPDKMPISAYVKMHPFSQKEIEIQPDDTFYMFSDGYQDQFNAKTGKKFKKQKLINLLAKNSQLSMHLQKDALQKEFEQWKQYEEQIDDIAVLGFRCK